MSLIFKTLKKLKDQPAGPTEKPLPPKRERPIYTFRNVVFSPAVVLLGLGLAVAACLGGLYLVGLFEGRAPRPAAFPKKNMVQPSVVPSVPDQRPGGAEPPASGQNLSKATDVPAAAEELERDATTDLTEERRPVIVGTAGPTVASSGARYLGASDSASQDAQPQFWPRPTPPPHYDRTASVQPETAGNAQTATSSLTKPLKPAVTSRRPEPAQKIFHNKMDQQAQIARLVAAIQRSMECDDAARTIALLKELEMLKGRDNAYVLKLKAYWHLRNGDLAPATALLNQVLRQNAEDLEAGINMAVVEMKTSQFKAASDRLSKLRQKYPDNRVIAELLQKLP